MYPRLAKRIRRTYIDVFRVNEGAVERLRLELSGSCRLPWGRLRQISIETGINERTLEGWSEMAPGPQLDAKLQPQRCFFKSAS